METLTLSHYKRPSLPTTNEKDVLSLNGLTCLSMPSVSGRTTTPTIFQGTMTITSSFTHYALSKTSKTLQPGTFGFGHFGTIPFAARAYFFEMLYPRDLRSNPFPTPSIIFDRLPRYLDENAWPIAMGDINLTLHADLDQHNAFQRVCLQGRAQLLDWMHEFQLVGSRRLYHPDIKECTGPSRKIDYILMSGQLHQDHLQEVTHDFQHQPHGADHVGIKFNIGIAVHKPTNRTPWKCPACADVVISVASPVHESLAVLKRDDGCLSMVYRQFRLMREDPVYKAQSVDAASVREKKSLIFNVSLRPSKTSIGILGRWTPPHRRLHIDMANLLRRNHLIDPTEHQFYVALMAFVRVKRRSQIDISRFRHRLRLASDLSLFHGFIHTKKRNRLHPSRVENLAFVYLNGGDKVACNPVDYGQDDDDECSLHEEIDGNEQEEY
ncbi:TPA: LOW QUALITY PROTEIN: hypothetical protein N0F65_006169 [Lagenidium giganteum]|uniref:Uncharacterized protein n=1 Tax=Lagenidium giganteum TaxID=4803 RepID=A0AAV2ZA93_9STRA|nr:TPA: LOW QUALITY PROTEIN: hypothetical protein N0F65_006169 [Lagenidium giganteum]